MTIRFGPSLTRIGADGADGNGAANQDGRRKRLVLVGAGHTHLSVLRDVNKFVAAGHRVTLITPGPFWYTGMMPGLIGGRYTTAEATIDCDAFMCADGATVLHNHVAEIDLNSKRLRLSSGIAVTFDVLSLNIGSEVALERLPGAQEHAVPVKPAGRLLAKVAELLKDGDGSKSITVAGGGIAAVEIALNLRALLLRHRRSHEITVATSSLLSEYPPRAARIARAALRSSGIRFINDSRVARVDRYSVTNEQGETWKCDLCIAAIGIRPPALLGASQLAVDSAGAMIVTDRLQSVSHPFVFGGGDCVSLEARPLARVGVYAVREGPVLRANLCAALGEGTMRTFSPQKRYMLIADLGDGRGMILRGRLAFASRWAMRLKSWIDRRFIRRNRPTVRSRPSAAAILSVIAAVAVFWAVVRAFQARAVAPITWDHVDSLVRDRYPTVRHIDADDLQQRLDSTRPVVLIDVRTAEEFAVSHLPAAIRVEPFTDPDAAMTRLPRTTEIVAYCSVGYRSADFVHRLQSHGYVNAVNLRGSIFRWANEGRPLISEKGPTDQVHPFDARWGKLLRPSRRSGP